MGITNVVDFEGYDDGDRDNLDRLRNLFKRLADADGGVIRFLPARASYLFSSRIKVPSNIGLLGYGNSSKLKIASGTTEPLLDLGASRGITVSGLNLQGNAGTQQSKYTGSCAIVCGAGAGDIRVENNIIENWGRHGIQFDGVDHATIRANQINYALYGAGILISRGSKSHNITITENRIFDTQFANIHAWGNVSDIVVSNNICEKTGGRGGHWDQGNIADNITLYSSDSDSQKIITNNLCKNSRESGIHASGSNLIITGNAILNPQLYGVLVSATPYENSRMISNAMISSNSITFGEVATTFQRGIGIRNCDRYVIGGNIVHRSYRGIELYGMDKQKSSLTEGIVTGNILSECRESIITIRGGVTKLIIANNSGHTDGSIILRVNAELSNEPLMANNLFEINSEASRSPG